MLLRNESTFSLCIEFHNICSRSSLIPKSNDFEPTTEEIMDDAVDSSKKRDCKISLDKSLEAAPNGMINNGA